jgi:hypothetical protein
MLPDTVVLSEVNPSGSGSGWSADSPRDIPAQARAWYGIEISAQSYVEQVQETDAWCREHGRHLVIRDWTTVDFRPLEENGWKPSRRLAALEVLRVLGPVRPFVMVRDVIDVWLSSGAPDDSGFFEDYADYVRAIEAASVPVFRYEDFVRSPRDWMQRLCATVGLPYDDAFLDFQRFTKVSGDVQLGTKSRGLGRDRISALPRVQLPVSKVEWLNGCSAMREANKALGYPVRYEEKATMRTRMGLVQGRIRRSFRRHS